MTLPCRCSVILLGDGKRAEGSQTRVRGRGTPAVVSFLLHWKPDLYIYKELQPYERGCCCPCMHLVYSGNGASIILVFS